MKLSGIHLGIKASVHAEARCKKPLI